MGKKWGVYPALEEQTNIDFINEEGSSRVIFTPVAEVSTDQLRDQDVTEIFTITEPDLIDISLVWESAMVGIELINQRRAIVSAIMQHFAPHLHYDEGALKFLGNASNNNQLVTEIKDTPTGPKLIVTTPNPVRVEVGLPVPFELIRAQEIVESQEDVTDALCMKRLVEELGEANFLVLCAFLNIGTGVIAPKNTHRKPKNSDRAILSDFIPHKDLTNIYKQVRKDFGDSSKRGESVDKTYERVMKRLQLKGLRHTKTQQHVRTVEQKAAMILPDIYSVWYAALPNKEKGAYSKALGNLRATAPYVFSNIPEAVIYYPVYFKSPFP